MNDSLGHLGFSEGRRWVETYDSIWKYLLICSATWVLLSLLEMLLFQFIDQMRIFLASLKFATSIHKDQMGFLSLLEMRSSIHGSIDI